MDCGPLKLEMTSNLIESDRIWYDFHRSRSGGWISLALFLPGRVQEAEAAARSATEGACEVDLKRLSHVRSKELSRAWRRAAMRREALQTGT